MSDNYHAYYKPKARTLELFINSIYIFYTCRLSIEFANEFRGRSIWVKIMCC